jgi:AraC-like DNA-binding protein
MSNNFFDYFPVSTMMRAWGLWATSFGHMRISPRTNYPPAGHPQGHHFVWNQGRVLQEYQLLYIEKGQGVFETFLTKPEKIGPGTIFLLFPGIWHRYRPDFATGWTESWIELSGPYIDQLLQSGIIDPRNPVHQVRGVERVEGALEAARQLVRSRPPNFSVRLGLLAVQILTLLRSGHTGHPEGSQRIDRIIAQAQTRLAQDLERTVSAEQIAHSLGIGYSYFRREFKRRTGFSPKQYRIEIRHRRAKDLLRNGNLTIKEISEQLGYSSSYHLSLEFSRRSGLPPTRWRATGRLK